MTRRVLTGDDFRAMPWRNGGGSTCELYRLPHPQRPDDFALRLSIATVAEGGPFSSFPLVDRTLLLLEGDGMALQFEAGEEVLLSEPLQPLRFAGEAAVSCRLLGGSLRDFNLMVARDWGEASLAVEQLAAGQSVTLDGSRVLVYLLQGQLDDADGSLLPGQLLLLQEAAQTLTATTACRYIRVVAAPRACIPSP
ncbi:hypothetical protein GCM10007907_13760 [Chitinimonas prasina]|uniref:HutD family protein n=1 Tax=Chitinimonas prasina TaxID=1434937 RepID=A0ABQ5YH26_9NEIS|nr:HutD family protein [Chitinimonas prasina]GLR12586.1 hypothetical protein GCM10007907_13760 [Chitinimonas prasina]